MWLREHISTKNEKNTVFILNPENFEDLQSLMQSIDNDCRSNNVKPQIKSDMYFDEEDGFFEAIYITVSNEKADETRKVLMTYEKNHQIWVD